MSGDLLLRPAGDLQITGSDETLTCSQLIRILRRYRIPTKQPPGSVLSILKTLTATIWRSFTFLPARAISAWQQKSDKLFLGIDHTAIVVSKTQNSLELYRDVLGLKLAGESMNYGAEQERLNNVAGARLRISGLRAKSGPGVEFLEYLAPRDGRPAPKATRANDLWHWQTTLLTTSVENVARKLNGARARMISPGVAEIPDKNFGFMKGFLARDPDGHGLQLIEK